MSRGECDDAGVGRRRLVLIAFLVLGLGASAYAVVGWRNSSEQVAELESNALTLAEQGVSFTIAGIEHAMLAGKGVMIKQLLERYRAHAPDVDIHIYDNLGYEVFREPPSPPPIASLPADVRAVLTGGPRSVAADGRVTRPIADEDRCHACHTDEKSLRGVLVAKPNAALLADKRHTIIPLLIRNAFINTMTSDHAYMLDDFFNQLQANTPSIAAVGLYGNDSQLRFGNLVPGLSGDDLAPSLVPNAAPRTFKRDTRTIALIPLPREQRCAACHKKDTNPVRGVLAVAMTDLEAAAGVQELESVNDSSIRVIMMSSLGRMILRFLRSVGETGALTDIVLYDNEGRTYFSPAPATPPALVGTMLATPNDKTVEDPSQEGTDRVMIARTLANEGKCITCHGTDSKIRGVVTMSLPRPRGDALHSHAIRSTTLFTAIGLCGALLVVFTLLVLRRQPT